MGSKYAFFLLCNEILSSFSRTVLYTNNFGKICWNKEHSVLYLQDLEKLDTYGELSPDSHDYLFPEILYVW